MLAIMKTVQSLYFLGKVTKMVADQTAAKSLTKKPIVSYSWKKSFKTVKEHMLLSLIAFEASSEHFFQESSITSTINSNQLKTSQKIT